LVKITTDTRNGYLLVGTVIVLDVPDEHTALIRDDVIAGSNFNFDRFTLPGLREASVPTNGVVSSS
jgi:hypothetical protein